MLHAVEATRKINEEIAEGMWGVPTGPTPKRDPTLGFPASFLGLILYVMIAFIT